MRFDARRLIMDMGGAAAFSALCGTSRSTPYRWMQTGKISGEALAVIKSERPDLNLDAYFIEEK